MLKQLTVVVLGATLFAQAAPEPTRRPERFAIIFNRGYAGDHLPKDPASFTKLIRALKQAHFNTILCKYEPWRAAICRKYGIQIFVDLLVPEHHVYKNVAGAQKLCESLRGNDVVYGYHLWSDNIGNTYPGRSRDVKNVHTWDPTHPAYVGTYRMSRVNRVDGLDLLGYYDFHWRRGGHWGHVSKASSVARGKNAFFLRYCDAAPGRVGMGNVNRAGYTMATSIPFGLKGYLFHYGGGVVDKKTGRLDALGKDLESVNARFSAIGEELMAIGNPTAVYSTPITTSEKNRPIEGAPAVPGGLAPIPEDHWFRVTGGEVLFGLFKDPKDHDVAAFATHNPYQSPIVTLEFATRVKAVSFFDRKRKRWTKLKLVKNKVSFPVEEYATELVRFER